MAELQYTGSASLSAEKRMRREIKTQQALGKITVDDAKALHQFMVRRPDAPAEAAVTALLGGFDPKSKEVDRLAGVDQYRKAAADAIATAYVAKATAGFTGAAAGRMALGGGSATASGAPAAGEDWQPAGDPGQVEFADPNDDWSDFPLFSAVKQIGRVGFTAMTTPFELMMNQGELVSGLMGGQDNNDLQGPQDAVSAYVGSLSLTQLVKNWNSQGDGWIGLGDEAERERMMHRTALHNTEIDVNQGKWVMVQDPGTGNFKRQPLPPQMVKVHQDVFDSVAEALSTDAMEQSGMSREIAQVTRIVGSVVLDPLNLVGLGLISKANKAEKLVSGATAQATAARTATEGKAAAAQATKRMADARDTARATAEEAEAAADEARGYATEVMDDLADVEGARVAEVLGELRAQQGDVLGQADTLVDALREKALARQADANDLLVDSQSVGAAVSRRLSEVEDELRAAGDLKGAELHRNTRRALDDARSAFAARMQQRADSTAAKIDAAREEGRAATAAEARRAGEKAIDGRFAEQRVNAAVKATEDAEEVIGIILRGGRQTERAEGPALVDGRRVWNEGEDVADVAADVPEGRTTFEAPRPETDALNGGDFAFSLNQAMYTTERVLDPVVFVDKNGARVTISHGVDAQTGGLHVFANTAGRVDELGELRLKPVGDGQYVVDMVSVKGSARNRGIARAMWDYAKRHGTPLHDPENQTRLGKAYSGKVDPGQDYVVHSFTDGDGADWFRLEDGTWSKNTEDTTGVELRFDEPGAARNTSYSDDSDYSFRTPFEGAVATQVERDKEWFSAGVKSPRFEVSAVHGEGSLAAAPEPKPKASSKPAPEGLAGDAAADKAELMQAVARLRRAGSRGTRSDIDEAIVNLRDTAKRMRAKWKAGNADRAKVDKANLKADEANLKNMGRQAARDEKAAEKELGKADSELAKADDGDVPGVSTLAQKAETLQGKIDDVEALGADALPEVRALRRDLKKLQAQISAEARRHAKNADEKMAELRVAEEELDRQLELLAKAYEMDDVANAVRNGDVGVLDDLILDDMGVHRIDGVDRKKLMDYFFGPRSDAVKKVLSLMDDAPQIWEMSGRQIPIELAWRIAQQSDPEKVVDEIIWALGSDSGIVGQVRGPGMRLAAKQVKQGGAKIPGGKPLATVYEGSHARVPWGYSYDLDDLETLFAGMTDWMRFTLAPRGGLGKLSKADQAYVKEHQVRLLEAGDDPVKRRQAAVQAWIDLPDHLIETGRLGDASPDMVDAFKTVAQRALNDWSEAGDGTRAYLNVDSVDDVRLDGVLGGVRVDPEKVQRLSQMQSEIQFPSPKTARDLVVRGTALQKAGAFGKGKEAVAKATAWMDIHVNQIWRQSVLAFRVAYTIRNAGEMMFRMWLGGDLQDPGTIIAMALNTKSRAKANRVFATYGKDVKGRDFNDPQYGSIEDVNKALHWAQYRHHAALDTGDVEMLAYNSYGEPVEWTSGKKFDKAMSHNLLNMWADPIWREVMLTHSGIGSKRVMTWAKGKGIEDPHEGLFEFFRNGPGKKDIDRLLAERPEIFRDEYRLDQPDALRTWLLDATQEGTWAGQTSKYTFGFNRPLMDALMETFDNSAGGAQKSVAKAVAELRKDPAYQASGVKAWALQNTSATRKQNLWTRGVNGFFDWSAAREGMAAYSPYTRVRYWHHVEQMFPYMDNIGQQHVLGVAREVLGKTGVTTKGGRLLRRLDEQASKRTGSGLLTTDDVHKVAAHRAAAESEGMFYDAMRNKQHWSALRIAIPFGAAWADTMVAWSKLMTRSKGAMRAYNLAKVYEISSQPKWVNGSKNESGQEVWLDPVQASSDPRLRAYVFPDPKTGEMSFAIPLVGSLPGFSDLATVTMPFSSLNVATGGGSPLPGPGPVLTIPFKTFRNAGVFSRFQPGWWDSWLDPFPNGEPTDVADVVFESVGAAWAKRVIGFVSPQLADSQLQAQAGPLSNYLFSMEPEKYAEKVTLEDGSVTWDLNDSGARRLSDDVQSASRTLSLYRGLLANVSPGSLIWNWQAKAQDGTHPMQAPMMEHWDQLIKDNGGNFDAATAQWLDVYGPDAAIVLSSNWKASIQPGNRAWKWMQDNPDAASNWGHVAGYFFPGGEWSFQYAKWLNGGDRTRLSPGQRAEEAISTGYYVIKSRLDEKVGTGEITATEAQERMKAYKEEYGVRYAGEFEVNKSSEQQRQIKEAIAGEPSLAASPAGQAASEYMRVRDEVYAELGNREHSGITSEGNEDLLGKLRMTGDTLAERVPDFGLMWQRVFAPDLKE